MSDYDSIIEKIDEKLEGAEAVVRSASAAGRSRTDESIKDLVDVKLRLEGRAGRSVARRARFRPM